MNLFSPGILRLTLLMCGFLASHSAHVQAQSMTVTSPVGSGAYMSSENIPYSGSVAGLTPNTLYKVRIKVSRDDGMGTPVTVENAVLTNATGGGTFSNAANDATGLVITIKAPTNGSMSKKIFTIKFDLLDENGNAVNDSLGKAITYSAKDNEVSPIIP